MNKSFTEIKVTDSTNNYAMQLIQKGSATHGMGIFAHSQTNGKGQRGKEWEINAGQNIVLSVILQTKALAISSQPVFNMAMALAAHEFFTAYVGTESSVKWANDIYWRDRKAGGILIENMISGGLWQWAIVGIGININQTGFNQHINAVSLKQISGKEYDPVLLAKELHQKMLDKYYALFTLTPETLLANYNAVLFKRNETVRLKKNNIVFDCFIKGVNMQGLLVTKQAEDIEQLYNSGEVQWLI